MSIARVMTHWLKSNSEPVPRADARSGANECVDGLMIVLLAAGGLSAVLSQGSVWPLSLVPVPDATPLTAQIQTFNTEQ